MPISVIPGGSGNALAYACGMVEPVTAAFAIVRGRARPFDIATVIQGPYRLASFLMMSWGIVADVDFESETMRWMGGARFTVKGLQRIAKLKMYEGTFSYYPESFKMEEKAKCTGSGCVHCLPLKYPGPPHTSGNDIAWEENGINVNDAAKKQRGVFDGMEMNNLPQGPPTPLIDALKSGDDSGWVHIVSKGFILLNASNVTHIASDMNTAPYAHLSDGCFDIAIVRETSKATLLKLFLQLEKGEHVTSEDVLYVKAKAFHLQPNQECKGSFIDVDGERMPSYEPVYAEMNRGLMNLITTSQAHH